MATSQTQKLSREDFRRQKVIDEKRKAGTLPAEVDPETGRDINPHIPHYLAQAPWYLDINHPTLKHQKSRSRHESKIGVWYDKGVDYTRRPTKFRKGACENCGAITHSAKDCVERPRKTGARWTGDDLKADEKLTHVELDFEAKRDRWNGYDPSEHSKLIEEWELIEKERVKVRERQMREREKRRAAANAPEIPDGEAAGSEAGKNSDNKQTANSSANVQIDTDSDDEIDEDKYAEAADMPGQKLDTKTRTTVRNLRIREDTAKYLLNLDVNSSYYDPKTRSMRENPIVNGFSGQIYKGDNFLRWTGDAPKLARLQEFAWEAESWGGDVHIQANPTETSIIHEMYQQKKSEHSKKMREAILQRYGGAEHMQTLPRELLLAQTENYVEYSQDGRVIDPGKKLLVRSRYLEDIYPLNHSSVWGSWWKDGRWGFSCCHSLKRDSFCTANAPKSQSKAEVT